ncbi:response regulator [Reinekea marinisedimentorum]|uniref:Response regulator receiver domain-containing protein n=1 Tax=Reinekea marinisedimentorum TaxID=230495 RepID=A0A4R3I794_9GAMM|nr:response regulator [Reinekea marinisedimentorum]TCS41620.1 response regulator receiver domain-containing protein [Reinekea marinisedimentorum]
MQRVLIVDDSKTAQVRLKKMLGCYNLAVDTAYSAEEALYYLKTESPVIIFLDHHMEGMDGLEALSIIKANPKTAVIPVIMYTSQQGDVYVSQARALGALDILSKDTMQFSNLERMLEMLNIFPKDTPEKSPALVDKKTRKSTDKIDSPEINSSSSGLNSKRQPQEIRDQISGLLEFHISGLRQQLHEQSYSLVRRLSAEIDRKFEQKNQQENEREKASQASVEESLVEPKTSSLSSKALWGILVVLGVVVFQNYQARSSLTRLSADYQSLIQIVQQEQSLIQTLTSKVSVPDVQSEQVDRGALIDALGWAVDADLQFGFDDEPLAEDQVTQISSLVYRLANAGFWGEVQLIVHQGNFCLTEDSSGNWSLADDDVLIQSCTFLEDIEDVFDSADYLSVAYANFEQSASPITSGQIELFVSMEGLSSPRQEYPSISSDMTAKEWNRVALVNNRVSVALREF